MENASGVAGTSMNGVYSVTVTSGSTFTYASSGTAGTGVTGSACISYDLANPKNNYPDVSKQYALCVPTDSMQFSISGDGSGSSSSMQVLQDDTPSDGPWFKLIPDQARVRLIKADTGSAPADDGSDLFFTALISNISAQLNGSGLGTISDVAMQDMTSLLDRVLVYSYGLQPRIVAPGGLVAEGGTVTVTTSYAHGLSVGGTVAITGAIGGGTAVADGFNGTAIEVMTIPAPNVFTTTSLSGSLAGTGNLEVSITSGTVFGTAGNQIKYFLPAGNSVTSSSMVIVRGVTADGTAGVTAENLVNGIFENFSGGPEVVVTTDGDITGGAPYTTTNATLQSLAVVTPAGTLGNQTLTIAAGSAENALVAQALSAVHSFKAADYAFQRSFNTSSTAYISGSSSLTNRVAFDIDAQSLRGVLDEISQNFQGVDGKPRRYFVDANGNLNYEIADSTAQPTYPTAPYKLITSGTQNPDTTSAAATLFPYSLQLGLDSLSTKQGMVTANAGTQFQPVASTYLNYGYANRYNAPLFEAFIDAPTVASRYRTTAYKAANSFFLQAHPPLLTGVATLRGAGKAAHNQYGFNAGYAQSGTASYSLVNHWEPGQYVDITCAELGLSGMYRIEQVDWTLEPGSYTQIITIVFSYKPQYGLGFLLSQVR